MPMCFVQKRGLLLCMLLSLAWNAVMSQANDSSQSEKKNYPLLSKGVNLGYRAGIRSKNNELLVGYYFDFIDIKRHRLVTFDADLWTNFKRMGLNGTISYSSSLFALSYATDVFKDKNQVRVIPALGLSYGTVDIFTFGVFYNYKNRSDIAYPTWSFKCILRPSFLGILTQNPDGSVW